MRERHIVLTGASGFLGAHVLRLLLAEGATVTVLVRAGSRLPESPGLRVLHADLETDFQSVLSGAGRCDGVVHLAQAGKWNAFPVNAGKIAAVSLAATARLAEYAVKSGAKTFLLASSGGIYGPSSVPIREEAPIRPAGELGFYLATKAAAETLVEFFAPHLTVHRLRYFFIYGDGQRDEFLMARMIRFVRDGAPIRLAGGRGPLLNPIHVGDAARATLACLKRENALTANIAGPEIADLASITRSIGRIVGRAPHFETGEGTPEDYVADTSLMREELCAAEINLSAGLTMACNAGQGRQ